LSNSYVECKSTFFVNDFKLFESQDSQVDKRVIQCVVEALFIQETTIDILNIYEDSMSKMTNEEVKQECES
jgi:hypothetical protein